jgi:hypothetical protein
MSNSVDQFGRDVKKQARALGRRVGGDLGAVVGKGLDSATDVATGATSAVTSFIENELADIQGKSTKPAATPVQAKAQRTGKTVEQGGSNITTPGFVVGEPSQGDTITTEQGLTIADTPAMRRRTAVVQAAADKVPSGIDEFTLGEMFTQMQQGGGGAKGVKSILEKYELGEGIYGLRRKAFDMSKSARGTLLTPTYMNNVTGEGGTVISRG